MAGDGEGLADPRQRRDRVVHRAAAQQRPVAVGVEAQPSADALLDEAVEVDARDAQAADGVARLEAAPVAHGQPAHELLVRDVVRSRVSTLALMSCDERGALLAVGGVEPGLLDLRVGRRPERVGEHEAADDQQQVADEAEPAATAPRRGGAAAGVSDWRRSGPFRDGTRGAGGAPQRARLAPPDEEAPRVRSCDDVHDELAANGVPHEILQLPSSSRTAQLAAEALGVTVGGRRQVAAVRARRPAAGAGAGDRRRDGGRRRARARDRAPLEVRLARAREVRETHRATAPGGVARARWPPTCRWSPTPECSRRRSCTAAAGRRRRC